MSSPLIKIARDGKTIGEYTLADLGQALRAKTILPTDHYWREGMKAWERVHFIAAEAEAAIPKAAPSPPPPPPKSAIAGSTSTQEASIAGRLYLVLGALAFPAALLTILSILPEIKDRVAMFRLMPPGDTHRLRVAEVIEGLMEQQMEACYCFIGAWILSRLLYFVIKGKVAEADAKKVQYGNALFMASVVALVLSISYAMSIGSHAVVILNLHSR